MKNNETSEEKLGALQEKILNLYDWKSQIEVNQKDSLEKFNKNLNFLTQDLKKNSVSIQSLQESVKNLKNNLNNISNIRRPVTPPRPPTPPPLPPPVEFPLEEIYLKISTVQEEISEKIITEKEKIMTDVSEKLKNIESKNQKTTNFSEHAIQELEEKLAWLPISLSQLKGMPPEEARLFTIEARLRSEENSRIQSFNYLLQLLDYLLEKSKETEPLESIDKLIACTKKPENLKNEQISLIKPSERKKTPPVLPLSTHWWKKNLETDRKNYTDSASVLGTKLKFSTPVPEYSDHSEMYLKYKELRNARNVPKSCEIQPTVIPRIQTAIPSNLRQFKSLSKTKMY